MEGPQQVEIPHERLQRYISKLVWICSSLNLWVNVPIGLRGLLHVSSPELLDLYSITSIRKCHLIRDWTSDTTLGNSEAKHSMTLAKDIYHHGIA